MPRSTSAEKIAQIAFYGGESHFVDSPAQMYTESARLAAALGRRQRGAVPQARYRFKKLHHLVGAEHHRQLSRVRVRGGSAREALLRRA